LFELSVEDKANNRETRSQPRKREAMPGCTKGIYQIPRMIFCSCAKRSIAIALCFTLIQLVVTSPTKADFIRYQIGGEITFDQGVDNLGLVGANFLLTLDFDTESVYEESLSGLPMIRSINDSLVISGATMPQVNGTYFEDFGSVSFFPTFNGTLYGGSTGGDFANWQSVADTTDGVENFRGGFFVEPVALDVLVGDTIDISHFGTEASLSPGFIFQVNSPGAFYGVTDFQSSISIVPEPCTALPVMVLSCALMSRRRRRSSI